MSDRTYTILGLETSCDETAVALVRGSVGSVPEILANHVLSQIDDHAPYGGVVPEIAARAHIEALDAMVTAALSGAGLTYEDLDGIAATAGPGLLGGVIVGLMTAKGIAHAQGLPLIAVNHLVGHALSVGLVEPVPFPYLLLLISGGHCQLLSVESLEEFTLYGSTIDDAVGEAFDKTAKLLNLPYPGGPAIEKAAADGNPNRFDLPRPLITRPGCDFSFSGLKTAVRHAATDLHKSKLSSTDVADLAASFQQAVADVLKARTSRAMDRFLESHQAERPTLVVAGGVAANQTLREALNEAAGTKGFQLIAPPPHLCTDNGAMIAWAGLTQLALGGAADLSVSPRARWPLDETAARPGAKA